MAYTYDDFLNQLNSSGLKNQFSQFDLDTAQKYPEFGISMISLKQDYNNAQTDQARALANMAAEQLRSSYGGYMGGGDGGSYFDLGPRPSDYNSQYGNAIADTLNAMQNYGSFSYEAAPEYTSRWDSQLVEQLGNLTDRNPFLYNLETDPVWSAYQKQYRREGDRATANAIAQAAAMTGGMPSSYATTAAAQAGDYYASQLSDMIPTLYQQAYERYLNEFSLDQVAFDATKSMEQMDYGKYQDQLSQYNTDRNLAYSQWQDQYNMLSNNLSAMQNQDNTEYGRFTDDLSWQNNITQQQLAQRAEAAENAAEQVDAILAAGGVPSAGLVGASGYEPEYVNTLANYYAQQAAPAAGSGGGGGYRGGGSSGRKSGSSGDEVSQGLFEAMRASGSPFEYLLGLGWTNNALINNTLEKYEEWNKNNQAAGQNATETPAGAPGQTYTPQQYQLFLGDMEQQRDQASRLNALQQAYEKGKITEEQVRQIAKQYGMNL